nr:EOG090X0JX7 [Cyclestheria hislopi]
MATLLRMSVLLRNFRNGFQKIGQTSDNSYCHCRNGYRQYSNWEVNTNVAKDVLLYHFENSRYHRILNAFAISQLVVWFYLSEFSYSVLRDIPVKETDDKDKLPWHRRMNIGQNKYRNGITFLCFTVGIVIMGASWFYSLKAVRSIVLRKGGQNVTIITYGPFAKHRYLEVPVKNVSASHTRNTSRVHLPLKVKGYSGHFLLDMKGEFKNTALFDATVGLKRIFK